MQHSKVKLNDKGGEEQQTANICFGIIGGLTNIVSASVLYCASVMAGHYKFGLLIKHQQYCNHWA
jgi:hypothetical protein